MSILERPLKVGSDCAAIITGPELKRPLSTEAILGITLMLCGVGPLEFFGKVRDRRTVVARSIAAKLLREFTSLSFPEIARAMGRPNHSSILTAIARLNRELQDETVHEVDGLELDVRKRFEAVRTAVVNWGGA